MARSDSRRSGIVCALALAWAGCTAALTPALGQDAKPFRVCADPNNLPFSNEAGEGFENKLAELIAADFGEPLRYAWHAQRKGFIRETLGADKCDAVIGLPKELGIV